MFSLCSAWRLPISQSPTRASHFRRRQPADLGSGGIESVFMGIDHKRFHDLRHTVATVMLEDGEAMNTVQEQLGHYDAGFTASRCGEVTRH